LRHHDCHNKVDTLILDAAMTRGGDRESTQMAWEKDIRCDTVPDPQIEQPRDAIIRVTSCASDLHLYDGFMPGMEPGDIIGH
jgi:hypothetical protein